MVCGQSFHAAARVTGKKQLQELHEEKINITIPAELKTTTVFITVLNEEQSLPSDSCTIKRSENPVEEAIFTNVLPPLKDTSLESCKFGHMMEGVCGK